MEKIFYPAILIMNRLGFSHKILLLGLINIAALAVVIISIYTFESKEIDTTKRELDGITLIEPILKTIQSTQRHRGLSSGFIEGEEKLYDELKREATTLKNSFLHLEDSLPSSVISSQSWQTIALEYQQLQSSGLKWTQVDNFSVHVHLIAKLQQLMINIADKHALTFDPDIAFHYLVITTLQNIPQALEQLGQLRAYGTGILADKTVSKQQKIKIHSLLATLSSALDSLAISLGKSSQYNQQIEAVLLMVSEDIKGLSAKITRLVHSDIFTEQFSTDPQAFFYTSTEAINVGYTQIYQTLIPQLNTLLHKRIQQSNNELLISIGSAIALALLAQYLFFGIFYATAGNIRLLARSARKYTQGDIQQRIHLDTKDDIRQIGNSFNDMADSFNQLLTMQKLDKDRLQSIVNSSLDAIIQINHHGIITVWSQHAEILFGWSKNEAIGQKIHHLIIPERHRDAHLKGIKKYILTGHGKLIHTRVETEALNRAGVEFPVELSMSPVQTETGLEFCSFIRDLSVCKQTENLLRKLSLAVEQSPSSIIITNKEAVIEYANQAFLNTTGYQLDEIIGKHTRILNAKKTSKETYDEMWACLNNGKIWQGELINRRKNGSEYTESVLISPVRQKDGEITHFLAIKDNITEKKQAEIELGIAAIAFESEEGIMVTDAKNKILRVNKSFTKITGYSADEVIGKTPSILSSGRQDKSFYSMMWKEITEKDSWQGEIWNRHKQGSIYPEWLTVTARRDEKNEITHYVGIFTDISKYKKAQEKINHLAYFDPLTQLANRRKLIDRLKHGIEMGLRENSKLAVLMLDLDKFKDVNDKFGHQAGDKILQQVAFRINYRLRATDLLARLGGDEFVILLEDINHPDDAARISEQIINDLARPFQINKTKEIRIGISIGISLYPEHADSAEILLDHADMALYKAKEKGRGCYSIFSKELNRIVHERLELEANLRQAITKEELRVYYQPQVNVITGEIIGAEALVRWQSTEGLIPPYKFIPLAEETGLILDVGEWVLQETCRQGQQWLKEGLQPITLAVNVSPKQFKHSNLHDIVEKVLHSTEFPATQLELEMTETGLMEQQEAVVGVLNKLRSLGILLAIDDFGTGYSSLAYLKKFPLDVLKIDKSFIDDVPHEQDAVEIAKTINEIGHTLGFKVLAEGVEHPQQLDFLKQIGCDIYQGYIKSKPLPANEFEALLRSEQTMDLITEKVS